MSFASSGGKATDCCQSSSSHFRQGGTFVFWAVLMKDSTRETLCSRCQVCFVKMKNTSPGVAACGVPGGEEGAFSDTSTALRPRHCYLLFAQLVALKKRRRAFRAHDSASRAPRVASGRAPPATELLCCLRENADSDNLTFSLLMQRQI